MGYMGLRNWNASDQASDLVYYVTKAIVKELNKGIREKGNEFNTNGPVNVALFNEAFILPIAKELRSFSVELSDILSEANEELEDMVDEMSKESTSDWGGAKNKRMHLDAYKRMMKNLDKTLTILNG